MTEQLAAISLPESDFRERNREEFGFPYKFSIVMSVYNVEPFLREAVDSVLAQDIGFKENVQLILVDDGSQDSSGVICDEYQARFPENIVVIHKENGGVSSARNEGLKYAEGRYINFMDSDDKFSRNVLSKVYNFFVKHEEEVDVVCIPIFFFDGAKGAHPLNEKFKKGTRIINLLQLWEVIQLSCCSAFVQIEAAKTISFDTSLAYGEDGKEMLKLLLRKMRLGVVCGASYLYRKRIMGAQSALQNAMNVAQWYTPCLNYFIHQVILISLDHLGYVPKFVQYALMYDIQWRILQKHIPEDVLNEDEAFAYKNTLFSLLKYFDDDVIMAQKNIQTEHKAYLLRKKYNCNPNILWGENNTALHHQNTYICTLNTNKTQLDFITVNSSSICLEGFTVLIEGGYKEVNVFLEVNENIIPCVLTDRKEDRISLDEPIYSSYGFQCEIPFHLDVEVYKISVFCEVDGNRVNKNKLIFGKRSPISSSYQNSFYYNDGYLLTVKGANLFVQRYGRKGVLQREKAFLKELWDSKKESNRKAVKARLAYHILKQQVKKPIWLVSDRTNKAGDNGEAFFRYLNEYHSKEIDSYFVLSKNSPDFERMSKIGKVVDNLSFKHKLLYLLCEANISSQGDDITDNPFQSFLNPYRDLMRKHKFIFLQHGVIQNDLSDWLNRYNKNISLFVTTTNQEYQSILTYPYYYDEKVVKKTGLPRYDLLYHNEKKYITIMPTWRAYLVGGIDPDTGKRPVKAGFEASQYYQMYDELLNCGRLFDAAEQLGYQIRFLNHPNMVKAKNKIAHDLRLLELGEETSYRTIFAESDLLITDYSSVAFDFAYLRKPVLYYQADVDEIFSGAHTFEKGYFDYERDGFGEVEYSTETLVDRIIEYMENGCELKESYRKRIDETFPFSDQDNCKRVYEAVKGLSNDRNEP